VRRLRASAVSLAHPSIVTAPGEEAQVDYGDGPMVRHPETGKYRLEGRLARVPELHGALEDLAAHRLHDVGARLVGPQRAAHAQPHEGAQLGQVAPEQLVDRRALTPRRRGGQALEIPRHGGPAPPPMLEAHPRARKRGGPAQRE
jgi:hypothetical protein